MKVVLFDVTEIATGEVVATINGYPEADKRGNEAVLRGLLTNMNRDDYFVAERIEEKREA